MIYLASPYTHANASVRQHRYIQAIHAVATYAKRGENCYSPVVHFHMAALIHELPGDFHFWQEINYAMIDRCDSLVVLKINGWDTSFGVMKEIEYAVSLGKPVSYLEESDACPA